jgi:hypothetical protein
MCTPGERFLVVPLVPGPDILPAEEHYLEPFEQVREVTATVVECSCLTPQVALPCQCFCKFGDTYVQDDDGTYITTGRCLKVYLLVDVKNCF